MRWEALQKNKIVNALTICCLKVRMLPTAINVPEGPSNTVELRKSEYRNPMQIQNKRYPEYGLTAKGFRLFRFWISYI